MGFVLFVKMGSLQSFITDTKTTIKMFVFKINFYPFHPTRLLLNSDPAAVSERRALWCKIGVTSFGIAFTRLQQIEHTCLIMFRNRSVWMLLLRHILFRWWLIELVFILMFFAVKER